MAKRRPTTPQERRRYPRLEGTGLMVRIGGMLVPVLDVSASGMKVPRTFRADSAVMDFTLYPCHGSKLDLNHGVRGLGKISHLEPAVIGIAFEPPSLALVKLMAERG
jgi:hypothetical protein